MKILLVADHPDDARTVEASLLGDGHSVTTCNDRSGGPCRGVEHLDDCPLESSVDLAVVARSPHGRRGIEEMGSVCAARHRVGVVEIDPSVPDDRSIYDLADAAEHDICRGYTATVERRSANRSATNPSTSGSAVTTATSTCGSSWASQPLPSP